MMLNVPLFCAPKWTETPLPVVSLIGQSSMTRSETRMYP
jgi:hypothetical protein